MPLNEISALTVNGREVSLGKVLKLARIRNSFPALDEKIEIILLNQAAGNLGITVSDEELQTAVDDFRLGQGLYSAADTAAWLTRTGIELDDLEELLEAKLLGYKIREAVSKDKIEKYFNENILTFESALLSHLVVPEEGEAQELKYQINEEGADFNSLAREYSIDDSTRLAGGFMGSVARSKLNPEAEAAVFGASDGEVVGPFKTDLGYHLIKVEKINKAIMSDNTVEYIKNILYNEWLANQHRKSTVDITIWKLL